MAVQPVEMVARVFTATDWDLVVLPEQLRVITDEPEPPLYAWRLTNLLGLRKLNVAWVRVEVKETFTVVKDPQGGDIYHWLVPQLTTPVGYSPLRLVFKLVRPLKSMTEVAALLAAIIKITNKENANNTVVR